MSDITFAELIETPLAPAKKMGRPKGSKNKPKETMEINPTYLKSPVDPLGDYNWTSVLLKSELVPDGLPMIVYKPSIKGVSRLPDGGASIILHVSTGQPMILTTLTPYDKVVEQVMRLEF